MGDKEFPSIYGSASALRAVVPKGRGPAEGEAAAGARLVERLGEGLTGYHFRGDLRGEQVSVHLLREGVTDDRRTKFQAAVGDLLAVSKDGLPASVLTPLSVSEDRTAITLPAAPTRHLHDLRGEGHSLEVRLESIAALALCLEALHEHGLVHGALSPSTVYIDDTGAPVVAGCSGTSLFLGTVGDSVEPQAFHAYASPEAKEGTGIDARSDIFSLGKVLHFLLTEVHPHGSDADLPPLETLRESPRGLVRIVRKCTRPHPADRYQDVDSFLADLVQNDAADVGTGPAEGEDEARKRTRVKLPPRFDRRAEERVREEAQKKALDQEERAIDRARANAEVEFGLRQSRGPSKARFGVGIIGGALFAAAFVAPFVSYPGGTKLAPAVAVVGAALVTFLFRGRGPRGAYYELAAAALAAVVVFAADPTSVAVRAAAENRMTADDASVRSTAARFLAVHGHRAFVDVDLRDAVLDGLSLDGGDFDGADLQGADLRRSNLTGANFYGTNVAEADFSGAELSGAEVTEARGLSDAYCDDATQMPTGWRCVGGFFAPDEG
ncbi:MAG: pentapeptide repeat-containing protein [Deltaproteobacteria bacterium]|nr:pentapeptide repeat-containing protein [Deltaproteobacteria bacterium]